MYAAPERFRGAAVVTDTADTCCEVGVSESAAAADGDNANDTDALDGSEDDEDSVSCMIRSRCTECCTTSYHLHVQLFIWTVGIFSALKPWNVKESSQIGIICNTNVRAGADPSFYSSKHADDLIANLVVYMYSQQAYMYTTRFMIKSYACLLL